MNGDKKGFLPCFEKHNDRGFPIDDFYNNKAFVSKLKEFLSAIVDAPNYLLLNESIHPKGGIQIVDPAKNKTDKNLCEKLEWEKGKIYRVDYGDVPYRLLFGLDPTERRCYILALDSKHKTRNGKKNSY